MIIIFSLILWNVLQHIQQPAVSMLCVEISGIDALELLLQYIF